MTAACAEDVRQEWLQAIKTERDAVQICQAAELITLEEGKRATRELEHDRNWVLGFSFEALFLSPHSVEGM
jgi:hypothetical protein